MNYLTNLNSSKIWSSDMEAANFVVYFPDVLPDDLGLTETNFRPENPEYSYPRSSLKFVFKGKNSDRELSIKEFNYDWSPPAYDCPSLWKNHQKFLDIDTPEPTPYPVGNEIFWVGVNYRNQRAASLIKGRTTVEIVVQSGRFSDQELLQIASHLQPVNRNHATQVLSKSFAELSYGYPHTVCSHQFLGFSCCKEWHFVANSLYAK
ncbi:MAG: hypothetical protein ABFQ95_04390 [Pseudomonadota bacterium]